MRIDKQARRVGRRDAPTVINLVLVAAALDAFGVTCTYTPVGTGVAASLTVSRFDAYELLNDDTGQYESRRVAFVDGADLAQPARGDRLVFSDWTGTVDSYQPDGDLWRLTLREDLTP